MTPTRNPTRSRRGSTELVAVFFLAAMVLIVQASLEMQVAATLSVRSFDYYVQRDAEADSIADAVTESIYAMRMVAPQASQTPETLSAAIRARLDAVGVSDAIIATDTETPPRIVQPPQQVGSTVRFGPLATLPRTDIEGLHAQVAALIEDREAEELPGIVSVLSLGDGSRTYEVYSRLFSVPITSVDMVAYARPSISGMPSSSIPVPTWTPAADLRRLAVQLYSATDPSARPDIFSASGGSLPYMYRPAVVLSWDLFQYIWTYEHRSLLIDRGYRFGVIDLASLTPDPSNGITVNGTTVVIDISLWSSTRDVMLVRDSSGGHTVRVVGSAASGQPFVLYVQNPDGATPTVIELQSDNARPFLLYPNNSIIRSVTALATGTPQTWRCGILAASNTSFEGSLIVSGHFSFPQSWTTYPSVQVLPDATTRSALAAVSPRALLVSSRAIQQ